MTEITAGRRYVAYYRVSTSRQCTSGLGLEAQNQAVDAFLFAYGGRLIASFTEIRSGKSDGRAQLAEALRLCRLTNSILLIAKLDRLSRNASFLLDLQNSTTKFVACDMPDMNETAVALLAVMLSRNERQSQNVRVLHWLRARQRCAAWKPPLFPGNREQALRASQAAAAKAAHRASELSEVITEARRVGHNTLRSLAAHLNALGIATPRGSQWTGEKRPKHTEVAPRQDSGKFAPDQLGPHIPLRAGIRRSSVERCLSNSTGTVSRRGRSGGDLAVLVRRRWLRLRRGTRQLLL